MNKNKKLSLILVAIVFCLGFMACSKEESAVSNDASTETGIEASGAETQNIAEKVEETSTEIAESVEETAEDAELYIPEGIDMESTLPGEEWVASFVGKVNEPVVVVFSDDTGRKEVVQANGEITINPDEDTIAVYWENEGMRSKPHAISVSKMYYYEIYEFDIESLRSVSKRPATITVLDGSEEYWVIEFTILVL